MKKDIKYLTFPTTEEISIKLKMIAHMMNKTQPELIAEICEDFINDIETYLKEEPHEKIDNE